jgi:hypothetical protein
MQRQLATQRNFTGGLNLRADQFQLQPSESPSLMNVDVDPRGGVKTRKGVAPWASSHPSAAAHTVMSFRPASGSRQTIAAIAGGDVYKSTGTTWGAIKTDNTVDTKVSGVQFNDVFYMQNGTDQPIKWTGTTATRLGQTWGTEDVTTNTNTGMPVAKCIAAHNGHVWVANTLESSVQKKSRVRFSHPDHAEDWYTNDYIDIDTGVDGDEIVAIEPFRDHLLVYKTSSIHAIYGWDRATFQVQTITREMGAAGPYAVSAGPTGVYHWAPGSGVWEYSTKGFKYLFDKLLPLVDDEYLVASATTKYVVRFLGNRLWCSVPDSTTTKRTFVMDPTVGNAWVEYDLPIVDAVDVAPAPSDSATLCIAAINDGGSWVGVAQLEVDAPFDTLGWTDPDRRSIETWWSTPWFDMNEPAIKKRFYRPYFTLLSSTTDPVNVKVYRDYDGTSYAKMFTVTPTLNATAGVWDTSLWDAGVWGSGGTKHDVVRGSALGQCRAVQLKFTGPTTLSRWGLDSVSLTYVPRKVR